MDAVDVSKVVGAKIGGVVERHMNELAPELQPFIEQAPEVQAIPDPDERRGASTIVAGKTVATMVIAAVLAQLRGHGCPEGVLEAVVAEARAYERVNSEQAEPS